MSCILVNLEGWRWPIYFFFLVAFFLVAFFFGAAFFLVVAFFFGAAFFGAAFVAGAALFLVAGSLKDSLTWMILPAATAFFNATLTRAAVMSARPF